jgi:SacI restriction endonuclease
MGIRIPVPRLEEVLERGVVLAESDTVLPALWTDRVRRISDCPSKTYIAALGTALLAKATEPQVDALSVKSKAGPRAYSMRGVVRVLVEKAPIYGYHLGRTGPEPLNNQPWFGSDRVDRFENVRRDVMPFHREMVRYLSDLNQASADEALLGLGAFLRERIAFSEAERLAAAKITVGGASSLAELVDVLIRFLREDTEGGRRGQALVASLFDLGHDEVSLGAINDPTGIDVSITDEGRLLLVIEVKQKPVDEAAVLHAAERAVARGADKALLVALSPDQRQLDRERVVRQAAGEHGVLAAVWESVAELVTQTILQAPLSADDAARELPEIYLRRMREHEVSLEGQRYWADLVAALGGSGRAD